MAITVAAIRNSNGITYTRITDTSADFASIANSTYFYNKADSLIRYKDATGTILEIFSSAGGASGVFGISNTSGAYTYYTTPALAYAAANVGQTIEMFADYTTSSADVINITKNVNWNGNGHTWTKTAADSTEIFATTYASLKFTMTGLNLVRQNGVSLGLIESTLFYAKAGSAGRIIMTGCYFENQAVGYGNVAIGVYPSATEIVGLVAKSGGYGAYIGTSATIVNCSFYGVQGCQLSGIANNCTFTGTTDFGCYVTTGGIANNCVGTSTSGAGFTIAGAMFNSVGRSTSGVGIETGGVTDLVNCTGVSVSGQGMFLYNSASKNIVNNTGISSSAYAMRFQMSYCFNGTFISTSNAAVWDTASSGRLYNCNLITNWNNANGWGIQGNGGFLPVSIIDCRFNLANASANYMNNGGVARVINMRGNTYEGGAAFNANITQGITTTEDNQGNIYL
jgi:hypothetical protein